ncbi:hypothetical protein AB0I28_32350 [Phytomonospora sp. NPDC050363]|uniref:hypothetical protein n=1 Tax=Phytomonospora sp. NPDC050363 TaxID=3155642 RepID=UPI0033F251FB
MSTAPPRHRRTTSAGSLKATEVARFTDAATGDQIIIETYQAGYDVKPALAAPVYSGDKHLGDVLEATGPAGERVYLLRARSEYSHGLVSNRSQFLAGGGTVRWYRAAEEGPAAAQYFYASVEDAKLAAGDERALAAAHERLTAMLATAKAAGCAVDGPDAIAWSRRAYEAACDAVGLVPETDDEVGCAFRGTIPRYTVEHAVWLELTLARSWGRDAERTAEYQAALAAADAAAPGLSHTRADYETACAAAGVAAVPDAECGLHPAIVMRGGLDTLSGSADYGLSGLDRMDWELRARRDIGALEEAMSKLAEQRRRERERLAAEGREFATEAQVDRIMGLLLDRDLPGNDDGFRWPEDQAGIANLSREQASNYISNLGGDQ